MKNTAIILLGLICLSFCGEWLGNVYYSDENQPAGYFLLEIIITNLNGYADYTYSPTTSFYASVPLSAKWYEYGHVYDNQHTHWYSPLYEHFFTISSCWQDIYCTNHQPPRLPPSPESGVQTNLTKTIKGSTLVVSPTLVSKAVTLNTIAKSGILNIYDESGKTIESFKVASSLKVTIPITRFSPGVYFAVLKETDGKESVKKFVVIK